MIQNLKKIAKINLKLTILGGSVRTVYIVHTVHVGKMFTYISRHICDNVLHMTEKHIKQSAVTIFETHNVR